MKNASLKEAAIKLPKGLANITSAKEIVGMVMDKTVTMAEYYRSRCKEFEQKYGTSFDVFKKKVESAKTENASEWMICSYGKGLRLPILSGIIKARNCENAGHSFALKTVEDLHGH